MSNSPKTFKVSAHYHNGHPDYDDGVNPIYVEALSAEGAAKVLVDNYRLKDLQWWTIEVTPISFGEKLEFSAYGL